MPVEKVGNCYTCGIPFGAPVCVLDLSGGGCEHWRPKYVSDAKPIAPLSPLAADFIEKWRQLWVQQGELFCEWLEQRKEEE